MADGKSQTASTAAQIDRACWAWPNDKHRETDGSDDAYFRRNWKALPGLKAYVERELMVAERFHAIADRLDEDD